MECPLLRRSLWIDLVSWLGAVRVARIFAGWNDDLTRLDEKAGVRSAAAFR
jgi:hypothetical protein